MSSSPPFDLGSLGEVDSPEVVKEALRIFRRRTLKSSIWVVAVVAMLAIPIVQQALHKDVRERFEAAEGFDTGTIYTDRGVSLVLLRVADLGERTGLHLVVTSSGRDTGYLFHPEIENVYYPDSEERGEDRVFEGWYAVSVPDDGVVRVNVFAPGLRPSERPQHEFLIDLKAAGVPDRLWQKEAVR